MISISWNETPPLHLFKESSAKGCVSCMSEAPRLFPDTSLHVRVFSLKFLLSELPVPQPFAPAHYIQVYTITVYQVWEHCNPVGSNVTKVVMNSTAQFITKAKTKEVVGDMIGINHHKMSSNKTPMRKLTFKKIEVTVLAKIQFL